jgi:hypothetical protein
MAGAIWHVLNTRRLLAQLKLVEAKGPFSNGPLPARRKVVNPKNRFFSIRLK